MVNKPSVSLESNFVGGLKTEFSALNFPENSCTQADNAVFSIIGTVNRRGGFNFEDNYQLNTIASPTNVAINDYKWNNVGGDGSTQIVVQQVGGTLYFYLSSSATASNPLSTQRLSTTVNVSSFVALGGTFDPTVEVTYADGNGYLFGFHPSCDPFYCTYNSATQTITATVIIIKIRDFAGVPELGVPFNFRPTTLSSEHQYNLQNQGWGASWTTSSITVNTIGTGSFTWTVDAGLPIVVGEIITANAVVLGVNLTKTFITGTVTSYSGTTLVVTETSNAGSGTYGGSAITSYWSINPSPNYISIFFNKAKTGGGDAGTAVLLNKYPSNAEQWWQYRSTNVTAASPDGTFKPSATADYVVLNNNQAPQGSIILDAFNQDRSLISGISNLTKISTTVRPSNGAFFDGRVFYTGVNASQQATGNAPYTTWTENIYFSQIITDAEQFGNCFQQNDPTSSTFFDLLPDDGGVINIQGTGPIYKLFPLKFGLLVFAANGIWFISGSTGIGFTATDYAITKVSNVQSISGTSIVNVLGWPLFWNEEGIYEVKLAKEAGSAHSPDIQLDINNLCLGNILTFYQDIPLQSKKFARGDYNPNTFVIQWLYKDTNESTITSRYQFNRALNINTYKAPFYPYSFGVDGIAVPYVTGVRYVTSPGGSNSPESTFKYLTVYNNKFTYSEENDFTNWKDWVSVNPIDYISTFTTGYKIHGQAQRQFGVEYIYVFTDNSESTQYSIQSIWNFSSSSNSGKWSGPQIVYSNTSNYGTSFRRIRLRGHGLAVQFKFTSVSGKPFSIIGWSVIENQSGSV